MKIAAKVLLWVDVSVCPCLRDWSKFTRGLGRGSPAGPGSVHVVCVWVLARPRVQAGVTSHSQTHAAGTRQFWGDSSIGSISSDQRQEWPEWHQWWDDPVSMRSMMQCQDKLLLLCLLASAVSVSGSEHIEASDDRSPWCISNCALWMPPWHESCFNVLFRTWKKENTVAFIWLHFAKPEGWKAQGLRWVASQIAGKRLNFGDS